MHTNKLNTSYVNGGSLVTECRNSIFVTMAVVVIVTATSMQLRVSLLIGYTSSR